MATGAASAWLASILIALRAQAALGNGAALDAVAASSIRDVVVVVTLGAQTRWGAVIGDQGSGRHGDLGMHTRWAATVGTQDS